MKRILYSLVLAASLTACSNPMSKAYSDQTVGEDLKAIKESGKLDTTQQQLLVMYMMQAKLTDKPLVGTTYQEMLEKAEAQEVQRKKEEAEQKALAEKAAAEEAARMQELRAVSAVTVFDKGFSASDAMAGRYDDYVTFSVAIQNKSPKDIQAITGTLVFNDLFDKPVKRISLTNDTGVKAGKTLKYESGMDYNQFIDSDKEFRYKELSKMKVVWEPQQILFADGTKMGKEMPTE